MFNKQAAFLVVDDLEAMRQVTASQLRTLGVSNIVTANSAAEALRLLRKQKVDIVLSDWNMPGMTGLELLRTIRADASLARLPFVMVTAEADRGRVAEAIASGVSGLLVKPYTAESLGARIEKALTPQSRAAPPKQEQSLARDLLLAMDPPAMMAAAPGAVAAAAIDVVPETLEEPFRATILVVDDAPANLHLLLNMFKDLYRVRVAQSGEKALEICQSDTPPDLVLLDIMMPGMDGFEVARRMREHPSSETIPVIFVTAMTGNDARLKGLELGAVDFVTKPIDPEVLKPRVRNFLRYVELHKQLQASYDGMFETARLREDVERITRHDIKGPLAGVIGLVQSMADDDTLNRKQQLEKLRMIEETALQVLNMINLSAELIKIETGSFKLDPQPVPIGDILRRIVKMSRASFTEKRITIVADIYEAEGRAVVQVLGDAMLCYSMFQNLIKNACEAAPENSRVTITMTDEDPLRIVILNKGAVPAEIRERFFDKFVTHNKHGGTGLGTYSAKLLAEAQAGAIALKVSDQENQTTITVTLPRFST
jgi:two-component system sensor histidine kinase/response regulator